jgi:hypothetical protein
VSSQGLRPRAAVARTARRVYGDYLQPERLDELQALLRCALSQGYRTMTLSAFAERAAGRGNPLILLLRHDIDTDVSRARRIWMMESRLGLVGSYFFRRSTWDPMFIHELSLAGCEVGYHYEELATVVKEHGAATAEEARGLLPAARARLRANVAGLRAESGLALDVFASHGDFANRAVGVSNVELLSDVEVRRQIGVRLEAYDIEGDLSMRAADGHQTAGWWPADPAHAIKRREPVVELLLHPRCWGGAPFVNLRADLGRMGEGCLYRLRRARRRP